MSIEVDAYNKRYAEKRISNINFYMRGRSALCLKSSDVSALESPMGAVYNGFMINISLHPNNHIYTIDIIPEMASGGIPDYLRTIFMKTDGIILRSSIASVITHEVAHLFPTCNDALETAELNMVTAVLDNLKKSKAKVVPPPFPIHAR